MKVIARHVLASLLALGLVIGGTAAATTGAPVSSAHLTCLLCVDVSA